MIVPSKTRIDKIQHTRSKQLKPSDEEWLRIACRIFYLKGWIRLNTSKTRWTLHRFHEKVPFPRKTLMCRALSLGKARATTNQSVKTYRLAPIFNQFVEKKGRNWYFDLLAFLTVVDDLFKELEPQWAQERAHRIARKQYQAELDRQRVEDEERQKWLEVLRFPRMKEYECLLAYKHPSMPKTVQDKLTVLDTVSELEASLQIRFLISAFNDKDYRVRRKTMDIINRVAPIVRTHWLVNHKLQKALTDRSVNVRGKAFEVLAQIESPPLYSLLEISMKDQHEKIQARVGEVFRSYEDWLIRVLVDDTKLDWVRTAAVHVLGQLGGSSVRKTLFEVLNNMEIPEKVGSQIQRTLLLMSPQTEEQEISPSSSKFTTNRRYRLTSTIKRALENAILNQHTYPIKWKCPACRGHTIDQLPLMARTVKRNVTIQGLCCDLAVFNENDEPLCVIEITFTHHPRQKTQQMIERFDLPVYVYWSTYTDLEELKILEEGLTGFEQNKILGYHSPCFSPRHPPPSHPAPQCTSCQQTTMKQVVLEVWDNYECYRKQCHTPMLVLKGWRRSCQHVYPGLAEAATHLGVNLKIKYSNIRHKHYLLHICPKCQGSRFYCLEKRESPLLAPSHPLRLGFYWWCPVCDRWEKQEIREWCMH
ncbi:MAG: HEAT repeat domain-containing protein [Candidatus Hodarchaeota archaeon]